MVGNLRELIPAFFVGPGGRPLSEEEIARRRQVAGSLLAQATDTSPTAGGGASVLAKAIQGLSYGINEGRADRAAAANAEASQANIAAMLGGSGATQSASAFPPAPSANVSALTGGAPDIATARVEQAHRVGAPVGGDLRGGIIETASALGIDPVDLATVISYETAGTFDPTKRGPTTQWGQHRGLIQFGEPQAKEYGVNWDDPVGSQLGANGAIANYLRKAGVTPGTGILDLYSAVNAGRVGRYNASDANKGGAPGTVRDKVERQMSGHRQKALSLLGDIAPTNAVAANEVLAAGQRQGGLTPASLQAWTAQNYNPAASIDRIAATGGAATPSTIGEADAREILSARPADASAYVGPGQLIAPSDIPGIMATPDEGVLVAESPEDIAAAELAMNDPAFAGPAVGGEPVATPMEPEAQGGAAPQGPGSPGEKRRGADGRMYQYVETSGMSGATGPWGWIPVADSGASPAAPEAVPQPSVQAIQALTALPVNESLPMAGGVDNPRPIVPTAPQNPMQGLNPAVVQALSNPNATPQERAVAQALLQQHVAQNQALQEQARQQAEQANMLAQRRGLAGRMGIDPNYAVDDTIWKAASDKAFRDAPSRAAGSYIERPDGTLEQVPEARTGDIQEYEYARANGYQGSFTDYQQAIRRAGASQTSIDLGGGRKFDEEFAKLDAQALGEVAVSGLSAQRNLGRIDQLETLLAAAPSGTEARFKQMAGEWGIPTEGLSEIQAAQALINSLVPEQRPAGSGPMSDADLELFKQSLPRVINQPGGNAMIINTMRAIAQYDAEGAAIVQQLRAGDINRQEAFQMLQSRQNPLANFKGAAEDPSAAGDGWTSLPNGVKIRPKGAN